MVDDTSPRPGREAEMLREFMAMYGADVPAVPTAGVHPAVEDLRIDLLDGEVAELRQAMLLGDLPGIAHELADCLYVLWGTALTYGLADVMPAVFAEVHRSNMTKDAVLDAMPGDRKLIKGPGFEPAVVADIVAAAIREGA